MSVCQCVQLSENVGCQCVQLSENVSLSVCTTQLECRSVSVYNSVRMSVCQCVQLSENVSLSVCTTQ